MKTILYLGLEAPLSNEDKQYIHYPVIKIIPKPIDSIEIAETFKEMADYTHIILTSKQVVNVFFDSLRFYPNNLEKVQWICIGKKTALQLVEKGFNPTHIAEEETAEGVIQVLKRLALESAYLFWPHSSLSREVLREYLLKQNIKFQECVLYETVVNRADTSPDFSVVDEIFFTSPSTVDAFMQVFGAIPEGIVATPIGPITQKRLEITSFSPHRG